MKSIRCQLVALLLFVFLQDDVLRTAIAQQSAGILETPVIKSQAKDLTAKDSNQPKHLVAARALVANLDMKNTEYTHAKATVTFAEPFIGKCDCSSLANSLLTHCYDFDADRLKKVFGSTRPTAKRYHEAIEKQRSFKRIELVQEVMPGDFVAIEYADKSKNTGHVMIVSNSPKKMTPVAPIQPDTVQWEVAIIDSSTLGHGPTDTRYRKGKDGKDQDGVGEGIFRIYTDEKGNIVGYARSTQKSSKFEVPKEKHLVIGRLDLESKK